MNTDALKTKSKMEFLDLSTWERSEHFNFFQSLCTSRYGFTVQQDVSELCNFRIKQQENGTKLRFSDMLYYLATRAANEVPEFRTRIVSGKPAIFDVIHPAFTYIPKGRNLHANCLCSLGRDFRETATNIEIARQAADKTPTLTPEGGEKPNLFYFSIVNGVAFTSASNPWGDCTVDSVPRILFGHITENDSGRKTMPVAVEALHGLIDGKHFGEFFQKFDLMCKEPEKYLK
ncbi:CatA-like O-acetyltransferase [Maridesulfovibrio sp.]|uniref:CatA-like O-acetyltransferase n=1 Tax=Maridesulfovibrio sp. TaxID=2795000 RepID=UPI0039EE903E